jgi:hypothetical protein
VGVVEVVCGVIKPVEHALRASSHSSANAEHAFRTVMQISPHKQAGMVGLLDVVHHIGQPASYALNH